MDPIQIRAGIPQKPQNRSPHLDYYGPPSEPDLSYEDPDIEYGLAFYLDDMNSYREYLYELYFDRYGEDTARAYLEEVYLYLYVDSTDADAARFRVNVFR